MRDKRLRWTVRLAAVSTALVLAACGGGGGTELKALPSADGSAGGAERSSTAAADLSFAPIAQKLRLGGDLPDLGKDAEAYELGASLDKAKVAKLAGALGLDGEPKKLAGGTWSVVDGERELRVDALPGLPWYVGPTQPVCDEAALKEAEARKVENPDAPVSSGVGCAVPGSTDPAQGGGSSSSPGSAGAAEPDPAASTASSPAPESSPTPPPGGDVECRSACPPDQPCIQSCQTDDPPAAPERPANLPTQAEAEDIAREAFDEAGYDLDDAKVQVNDGFDAWDVAVDLAVGGVPVWGMTSTIGVGPEGEIVRASGFLADPESLGKYPLRSVKAAFDDIEKRFSDLGTAVPGGGGREPAVGAPEPATDPAVTSTEETLIAPVDPPVSGEPVVRTITGAKLGLGFTPRYGDENAAFLVPIYVFTVDDGGELTATAVTAEHLQDDAVEPVEPQPEPLDGGEVPPDAGGRPEEGTTDGPPTEGTQAP